MAGASRLQAAVGVVLVEAVPSAEPPERPSSLPAEVYGAASRAGLAAARFDG